MTSLLLTLFSTALLLTTAPLTLAQQDDASYRLRLASSLGEPRVQAIAGQLPFRVQVKPRLARHHTLHIETKDGQISAAAAPGETIVHAVPRGLHTFYLIVKESKTGREVSRSAPLNLDVRRHISRQ
ncbi:MAG: hypothetical protein HN453_09565 [Gammaproteobacteria bacterium]|jgi:hypothetical protein|nr:hypothetical protein [Gammaproteobacteria bacterium]